MKVFVVGCGGWGMALSILLHENGHTVTSWTCFEEECKLLREQRGNESCFRASSCRKKLKSRPI